MACQGTNCDDEVGWTDDLLIRGLLRVTHLLIHLQPVSGVNLVSTAFQQIAHSSNMLAEIGHGILIQMSRTAKYWEDRKTEDDP